MESSIRDLRRVNLQSLFYVLKHWKACFSSLEKIFVALIVAAIFLTCWKWAQAAVANTEQVPAGGGTFIEGVVAETAKEVGLGRLNKAGLVRLDGEGEIAADLANSWQASEDKLSYTLTLSPKITPSEVVNFVSSNPTYLSKATVEAVDGETVRFGLESPSPNFLHALSKPVFSHGPFQVDKKTKGEIRLKRSPDYHLDAPFIETFVVKLYPDRDALQKAANKGRVTAAAGLSELPEGWQEEKITLSRRHVLFVNSLKSYLKSVKVREEILAGERPAGVETLDLLEVVNGNDFDKEYQDLKEKLKASGLELRVKKIGLKEALINDLPKRDYDLLYLLVSEELDKDPYLMWNSSQRSGDGQNFAELANADLDKLTEEYRQTDDATAKSELLAKIEEVVAGEKVAIEYPNIVATYAISPKVKGVALGTQSLCEADRFDLVSQWYFREKREKRR